MKSVLLVVRILLLVLGLGCLNYTTAAGAEHHQEWAQQHGLPEPSPTIFYAGAALTAVGAGSIGFALGRKRR